VFLSLFFCCPICRPKRQGKVAASPRPGANGGSDGLAAATIDLPCAGHHCLAGGREHHAATIPFTRRPDAREKLPNGNEAIDQDGQRIVGRRCTPPSSPLQFSQPTNPPILLFAQLIFQSWS